MRTDEAIRELTEVIKEKQGGGDTPSGESNIVFCDFDMGSLVSAGTWDKYMVGSMTPEEIYNAMRNGKIVYFRTIGDPSSTGFTSYQPFIAICLGLIETDGYYYSLSSNGEQYICDGLTYAGYTGAMIEDNEIHLKIYID